MQPCNKEGEVFWPPVSAGTGVVGQEGLHRRGVIFSLMPWPGCRIPAGAAGGQRGA